MFMQMPVLWLVLNALCFAKQYKLELKTSVSLSPELPCSVEGAGTKYCSYCRTE